MSTFLGAAIAGLAFLVFAVLAFGFVMAAPSDRWDDPDDDDK